MDNSAAISDWVSSGRRVSVTHVDWDEEMELKRFCKDSGVILAVCAMGATFRLEGPSSHGTLFIPWGCINVIWDLEAKVPPVHP